MLHNEAHLCQYTLMDLRHFCLDNLARHHTNTSWGYILHSYTEIDALYMFSDALKWEKGILNEISFEILNKIY